MKSTTAKATPRASRLQGEKKKEKLSSEDRRESYNAEAFQRLFGERIARDRNSPKNYSQPLELCIM
jgi:hypothetical protein